MKGIVFLYDEDADGRNVRELGFITADGVWAGDRRLELEVREKLRRDNLSLKDEAHRLALMESFSGTYMVVKEE